MKNLISLLIVLSLCLALCACGGEHPAVQESVPAIGVGAEPVEISQLPIYQSFMYHTETGAGHYVCYLYLYPQSGLCCVEKDGIYRECSFTEDEKGNIAVTLDEKVWNFRRTETGLELTGGSPLTAYMLENAENMVQISSGSEFTPMDNYIIRSGVYLADISEYTQFGDAPMLSIDLTNSRCALNGYDGSLYEGSIVFERDILCCIFEEGQVDFSVFGTESPTLSVRDELPFLAYPTAGHPGLSTFVFDENAEPAEATDSKLKDSRRLYYESFSFSADDFFLSIGHNALAGTWELDSYSDRYEDTAAVYDDGDKITISDGNDSWSFRRQGNDLVYEGGNPLLAYGPGSEGEAIPSMEVMPLALFERTEASYLYHMVPYILDISPTEVKLDVSGLEAAQARLLFDTEHKRFVFFDNFGTKEQGVLEYDGRWIRLHYGQSEMTARIEAHGLTCNASYFFSPMYIATNTALFFNPRYDIDPAAEGLEFYVDYAPAALPEDNCLPLTEEYIIYSEEDGFSFDSLVVLCPREKSFYIGSYGTDSGSYTESDGELVLSSEEHEYIFRRRGDGLIQTGGDTLYLDGNVYQGMWGISVELPTGCVFPLYSRSCIRSGIYQLDSDECSATISIDLDAMSCTLMTTDGTEYTSTIEINANRIRMEIPEGAFFLSASSVDGIRVSNLLEAVTIAPELDAAELFFKFVG